MINQLGVNKCVIYISSLIISDAVLHHENFNLSDVVTPVKADELERLLIAAGYEVGKTRFLVEGFKYGFSIGYKGPMEVQQRAPNLKFRGVGNKTILWNKVMKEVVCGPV